MDIRSFEFVAKAKQSQSRLEALMAKAYDKYVNAGTGSNGDMFEIAVVQVASACGIKTECVKAAGKVDLLVYLPGADGKKHLFRIEIKSGSGIVAQLAPEKGLRSIADFTEDVIMPGADLVIYAAKPGEFTCLDDLLDNTAVLTRREFIDMVSTNCGKRKSGFESGFSVQCNNSALIEKNRELPGREIIDKKTGEKKITKRGCERWTDCIVMQTSYLDARADAIDLGLATGEYISLRTWLEDNGRA